MVFYSLLIDCASLSWNQDSEKISKIQKIWYQRLALVSNLHFFFISWKNSNVFYLGPEPLLLFGSLFDLESKQRHEIYDDWFEKYGQTFCFHLPVRSTIVSEDLNFIKQILSDSKAFGARPFMSIQFYPLMDSVLQTSGKSWKNSRKAVSPVLTTSKVNSSPISEIFGDCIERFLDNLNPSDTHEAFKCDITLPCNRFSLDVILKASLGMEANVYSDNEFVQSLDTFLEYSDVGLSRAAQYFPFHIFPISLIGKCITSVKMIDIVLKHLKKTIQEYLTGKSEIGLNAVTLQSTLQHLMMGNINENEFIGNLNCHQVYTQENV